MKVSVEVITLRNGYVLTIGDESYLYFTSDNLIKGLCIHGLLGRRNPIGIDDMDALLKGIADGSAITQLQNDLEQLQAKYDCLRMRLKRQH